MWDSMRRQLRRQRTVERALPPVRAGRRSAPYPLSVTQRRLWYLEQASRTRHLAYNVTYAVTLHGGLDHDALRVSVRDLTLRHDALQTTFLERNGEPWQLVCPGAIDRLGLDDLDPADPSALDRWLVDGVARRFDLSRAAPFRILLARRAATEHVLLVIGHHIVLDGRSLAVLVRELGELYTARVRGRPAELAPVRYQCGDFVAWQRGWLHSAAAEPFAAHWRAQLTGPAFAGFATGTLDRPGDGLDHRGGRVERPIPDAVVVRSHAIAEEQRVPVAAVYLAAYQALLHLHADREHVVTGIPAANRGRDELAGVVGLLVNILPVTGTRDHRRTFREAVGQADASVSDAYAYQAMPIEHLLPEVLPALPRSALPVDTFFAAYRDVFRHPLSMPSVTVGAEPPIPTKDAEFPLGLAVWESSTAATAQLSYGAWAYCRADAEALGTAYVDLLARGTDDPDRPLGQLVETAGRTW